jgi:hypothetical protein
VWLKAIAQRAITPAQALIGRQGAICSVPAILTRARLRYVQAAEKRRRPVLSAPTDA